MSQLPIASMLRDRFLRLPADCDAGLEWSAFGFDTSLTVLFASVLAARHHQAVVGSSRGDCRCADLCGELVWRRKEQSADRVGGVGLSAKNALPGRTCYRCVHKL